MIDTKTSLAGRWLARLTALVENGGRPYPGSTERFWSTENSASSFPLKMAYDRFPACSMRYPNEVDCMAFCSAGSSASDTTTAMIVFGGEVSILGRLATNAGTNALPPSISVMMPLNI